MITKDRKFVTSVAKISLKTVCTGAGEKFSAEKVRVWRKGEAVIIISGRVLMQGKSVRNGKGRERIFESYGGITPQWKVQLNFFKVGIFLFLTWVIFLVNRSIFMNSFEWVHQCRIPRIFLE